MRACCRACVLCVRLSVSCCNLQITKEESKNREENPVAVVAAEHLSSSVIAQELEEQEQKQERRPKSMMLLFCLVVELKSGRIWSAATVDVFVVAAA